MRRGERVGHLARDAHRLGHGERPSRSIRSSQRLAVDVGHRRSKKSFALARVEQRQDVRMLEPCEDADLAGEAIRPECRRQLRAQHLHGNLAVVLQVIGEVDRGHPADPDLSLDRISRGEGASKTVDWLWHWPILQAGSHPSHGDRPRPRLRGGGKGQCETEPRSAAGRSLGPNASAVREDDSFGDVESEAGAFVTGAAAPVTVEHVGELLRWNTGPGVVDDDQEFAPPPTPCGA